MAQQNLKRATTSKTTYVFISSASTGAAITGLAYNTSGLSAYYIRQGDSSATAITLVTATVGTWTSGGFKEVDATNMPGIYEIGAPNAAVASGQACLVYLQGASGMAPCTVLFQLEAINNQDATGAGLTVLTGLAPSVASIIAGSVTGSPTSTSFIDTAGLSTYTTTGSLIGRVVYFTTGALKGQVQTISAYNGSTFQVTVASAYTGAPTNGDTYFIL